MSQQKQQLKLHSQSRVIIVIAIILAVNFLLSSFSLKFDLTQEKQYTLSPSSKQIVKDLQNPVTIKVFLSKRVPEVLFSTRQDLRDLLSEYDKIGGSNIIVEYTDPKEDEASVADARALGVQEIQFNTFGDETFEISSGYFGFAILYTDKSESFPLVQNTNNLEFDITSAIQKMTREKIPTLGVITGHGENFDQLVRTEIAKQYQVSDINISGELIEPDIDIALLLSAKQPFEERELFVLDQFVMSGRPLMIFAEGTDINQQFLTATEIPSNINELLSTYGVQINGDVIADFVSHEALQFSSGIFAVIRPYPAWPKVVEPGMNKESQISAKLRSLTFPWPSSISVTSENAMRILQTSPQSSSLSGESITLNPDALNVIPQGTQQLTIGALVKGHLKSLFIDREIPLLEERGEGISFQENAITQTEDGSLLVIGSSRFLEPNIINQSPENFILLGNALDVLTLGQPLTDIRARNANARPIKNLTTAKKRNIKYGNILGGVIISVLVAGGAFVRRKKKDRQAESLYSEV